MLHHTEAAAEAAKFKLEPLDSISVNTEWFANRFSHDGLAAAAAAASGGGGGGGGGGLAFHALETAKTVADVDISAASSRSLDMNARNNLELPTSPISICGP